MPDAPASYAKGKRAACLPVAELPHNPVDDRDLLVLHVIHHYFSNLHRYGQPTRRQQMRVPEVDRTSVSCSQFRFHRKRRSPRWKAGSMLPLSTTTMGDGESVTTERPFHI